MSGLAASFLHLFEILIASLWFGGIFILSGLVAPTLFAKLASRAQAGEMFGHILTRFYVLEIVLGLLLIGSGMLRWKYFQAPMGWTVSRLVLVSLMIGSTLIAQMVVRPQLKELRTKIGNFETTPPDNPNRVLFGKLHQQSVMLMSFNALAAILLVLLLIRKP